MSAIMTFTTGLIFGLGLILSGMTDPARVIGFLDLTGNWNPSLGLVMAGALLVTSLAFHLARSRTHAWLGDTMRMPVATRIDRRLMLGSLIFGAGWGLAGYCPGPAIVSLLTGDSQPVIFVLAMLAGMAIHEIHGHWMAWQRATAQER